MIKYWADLIPLKEEGVCIFESANKSELQQFIAICSHGDHSKSFFEEKNRQLQIFLEFLFKI